MVEQTLEQQVDELRRGLDAAVERIETLEGEILPRDPGDDPEDLPV